MRTLAPALLAALLLATACSGSSEAVSDPTTSSSSTTQTADNTTTTSEDTTDMTEASTPTELVLATREALFVDFDVAAAEALLAPDYIQHNPGAPTGAAPVLGLLPALGDSGLSLTTHRIFAAGDLVVAHNTYENADLFGAGFCGNKVTNVWKLAAKTGDSRARAEVMAMIERCPSGALTYAVDGDAIEPDLPAAVAVITDGPLWVSGHVEVTRADGQRLESRNRVTLCRCGQSDSKPMCDGSHKSAGFTG